MIVVVVNDSHGLFDSVVAVFWPSVNVVLNVSSDSIHLMSVFDNMVVESRLPRKREIVFFGIFRYSYFIPTNYRC